MRGDEAKEGPSIESIARVLESTAIAKEGESFKTLEFS
jgi:hypothetical protein